MHTFRIYCLHNQNYAYIKIEEGNINIESGIRMVFSFLDSEHRVIVKNTLSITGSDFTNLGSSGKDLNIAIIEKLLEKGAEIHAFDPEAMDNFKKLMGDRIQYCHDPYEALQEADALAIITEWTLFKSPDFKKMKKLMRRAAIFDGRNIYDCNQMKNAGFYYNSVPEERKEKEKNSGKGKSKSKKIK